MSIIIKRNTGWIGSLTKVQIKLNGEKVVSVKKNQQVEVELPNDKAYIKATQFGTKSNEIEVKDGDILEITTKWYQMSIPITIIVFLFNNFIPDSIYRIVALIIAVLSTISILLIDGFYIKVLDRGVSDDRGC
jgi:hypothetical protein